MSLPATASTTISSIPCPITALAPELREMIFEYYHEVMGSRERERQWYEIRIGHFRNLKPYFSMLHFSSLVRSEIAYEAYQAAFSWAWLQFKVEGKVDDVERMRDTFACIRTANRDIKLGIHFVVSDYGRDELMRFVNSFFHTPMTGGNMASSFVHCSDGVESSTLQRWYQDLNNRDSKIIYTLKSRTGAYRELTGSGEYHELYMFGKLAKLDWSGFDFEFAAPPQRNRTRRRKSIRRESSNPKTRHAMRGTSGTVPRMELMWTSTATMRLWRLTVTRTTSKASSRTATLTQVC
jgi:hypothetical protein